MMYHIRTIRLAFKSLLLHKLRSALTMLGIVFGVFSVIAMLAIGEGASAQAQRQVLQLGATNIIVRSVKPPENSSTTAGSGSARVLRYGILRKDYKMISESIPTIVKSVPIREVRKKFRFGDREMTGRLVGCTPDYFEFNHLEIDPGRGKDGRFLSEHDMRKMANVAVIAEETANVLFSYENPIGKIVEVAGKPYQVVGVTKNRTATAAVGGSLAGQDYNQDIYIPLKTFHMIITDLDIQRTSGAFSAEKIELNQVTLRVKNKEDVLSTAQVIRESLERNHPHVKDYAVVVPLELLKQADQIRYIFNFVLGSIAAISLIVGGIGIMNIMLATVTERTREIGIRRALGAKKSDIVYQFLTETIVLSGLGGIIGILMGLLTPFAFSSVVEIASSFFLSGGDGDANEMSKIFLEMKPQIALWSLPVAFGISVAIGVIFGVFPARSAAQLDPIEALRHE